MIRITCAKGLERPTNDCLLCDKKRNRNDLIKILFTSLGLVRAVSHLNTRFRILLFT